MQDELCGNCQGIGQIEVETEIWIVCPDCVDGMIEIADDVSLPM